MGLKLKGIYSATKSSALFNSFTPVMCPSTGLLKEKNYNYFADFAGPWRGPNIGLQCFWVTQVLILLGRSHPQLCCYDISYLLCYAMLFPHRPRCPNATHSLLREIFHVPLSLHSKTGCPIIPLLAP